MEREERGGGRGQEQQCTDLATYGPEASVLPDLEYEYVFKAFLGDFTVQPGDKSLL